MYNGIGLQTPRGSGTNGYVQRNMSFVPKSREKVNYKTEEDIKKLDALANKKPNEGILAHERKRLIELKCFEMQELMEEQGYPEKEIESKVALFRKMLLEKDCGDEREIPKDEFGRPIVKESHQMAEANQEKNLKMREALGISQYFVEGSSLDPTRKAKEAAAAAAEEAKKKYALIPDSSSSSPERTQEKEKVKKRKKKKSLSSHEKLDSVSSAKKKKSSKKHKKDRSVSPEHHKKKKSKKASKDKAKHKSKKTRNRSSSSSVASSSSADDESSSRSSSISSLSEAQSNASSFKRHKHSSKNDRNHKAHKKRSSSPESVPYTKESRSRKDLYEAKKGKRKRKSARSPTSSTSEDDSSPKQYYRLEPVLLKSKTKHKKTRQFIEVPKKSAYELKKCEKKKRVYESSSSSSSSSSSGTKSKPESKRRKHSSSPDTSKPTKYHSSRSEVNPNTHKHTDSSKISKRHQKSSCSPAKEKVRYEHSRSPENLQKKHKKNIPEDGSSSSRKSKNKIYSGYEDKNMSKHHKEPKHSYKRTSVSPEKSHVKKKYESLKSWHKRKESESPKRQHSQKDTVPVKKKSDRKDTESPKPKHKESRSPKVCKRNESESPKCHRYKESDSQLHRCKDSESPKHQRHKEVESFKHRRCKESESPRQNRKCKESPRQHKSRNSESPHSHNGYNDRARSLSVESGYSPGGQSSFSPFNEEKFITRSPSFPPKYKHKKHILNESPPYSSQTVPKNKISPKTSQKATSRTGRSTSKSVSPDGYYDGKRNQKHSSSPKIPRENCSSKKISRKRLSPQALSPVPRKNKTLSRSKSSTPEVDVKQNKKRRVYGDRSRSSSVLSSNSTHTVTPNPLHWKSKGEVKDIGLQEKNISGSPNSSKESLFKSRNTPQKANTPPERKSPKTFENSPPLSLHSLSNSSRNTEVFQATTDSKVNNMKRKHDNQGPEDSPNKITKASPLHSRNKNSNSDNEKIFFNIKSISIPQPAEDKTKLADENKMLEFSHNTRPENKKSKFSFGSFSNSQNQDAENVNNSIKINRIQKDSLSQIKSKILSSRNQEKNRSETPESSTSCSRNLGQNLDFDKSEENIQRTSEVSHSRSRSTSAAQSCSASGSERSSRSRSRSRSYSNRRSKSFSKSHSKSYSKSPSPSHSRSKSRSKSFSRSRSKSYSRSRSRSVSIYSRSRSRSYSSRSRSRSIARSPSIPRRRGSPSFLDKRRITSARKRPVPYRRPSPPTPSSTSSWSCRSLSRSSSPAHPGSSRSRSQSWSPILRPKCEMPMTLSAARLVR